MKNLLILAFTFIAFAAFSIDYSFTVNGKSYKIITTQKTWADAAAWAVQDGGYLVHINSQLEQDSIWAAIQASGISTSYTTVNDGGGIAYIWIGATDNNTEGTWLWDGNNDGLGDNFYSGQGQNGTGGGAAINNAFINWGGISASGNFSSNEPDDYMSNQDAAAIALDGWPGGSGTLGLASEWNDIAITNSLYFIVEYEPSGIEENNSDFQIFIHPKKGFTNAYSSEIITDFLVYNIEGKIILSLSPNTTNFRIYGIRSGLFFFSAKTANGIIKKGRFLVY